MTEAGPPQPTTTLRRTRAGSDDEREALAGLVERVTFHNPENGFCVLRVKARSHRDLVTVVGHAATISAGEFVQASGSWINDRTHSLQLKAVFLRVSGHCGTQAGAPNRRRASGRSAQRHHGAASLAEFAAAVHTGPRQA